MKNYKKAILASLAMVGTSCAIISGATFALFSNESTTNIEVTSGKVKVVAAVDTDSIKLYSMNDDKTADGKFTNGGKVEYVDNIFSITDITPGDKIGFDVKLTNESTVSIKYQLQFTAIDDNGGLMSGLAAVINSVTFMAIDDTIASNWSDVITVSEGKDLGTVSVSLSLPLGAGDYEDGEKYSCDIAVSAFAVQGNKKTSNPAFTDVVIPDDVTSLPNGAFRGDTTLRSITFGENSQLESIGNWAFFGCENLQSIEIPANVVSIGDAAFRGCTSLKSITFADGSKLESIGSQAFYACTSLESITIPNGVTTIGDNAFRNCDKLVNVSLPDGVTTIGDNAFRGCTSLESIELPDSLTAISDYMFYGTSLTELPIHANITYIGAYAFYGCMGLTSVTIPDSVTSIGESAFRSCKNLESVTISANVTFIGSYAFNACSGLTSATFANTEGWSADGTSISSEELKDSATAATYLRATYGNYSWTRA